MNFQKKQSTKSPGDHTPGAFAVPSEKKPSVGTQDIVVPSDDEESNHPVPEIDNAILVVEESAPRVTEAAATPEPSPRRKEQSSWKKVSSWKLGCLIVAIIFLMVAATAAAVWLLITDQSRNSPVTIVFATPSPTASLSPSAFHSAFPTVTPIPRFAVTNWVDLVDAVDTYMLDLLRNKTPRLPHISTWNVSGVTSMGSLFSALRNPNLTQFNEDLSMWDVGNVQSMRSMFEFTLEFNQDLSAWDTSQVTSMRGTFWNARSFRGGSIGSWNVSRVTDMSSMFMGAVRFHQDLDGWDVSRVRKMMHMFANTWEFNGNISHWQTRSLRDIRSMFRDAVRFDQPLYWDVSKLTSMKEAFSFWAKIGDVGRDFGFGFVSDIVTGGWTHQSSFNGDISRWNTSRISTMKNAFANCQQFNQDISKWDTGRVLDMDRMFHGATSFDRDLSRWNTSRVVSMNNVFAAATSFNHDLSRWDTSRVRFMNATFYQAQSFNQDLSAWSTTSVLIMSSMFREATAFDARNLGRWNVSRVISIEYMFANATALEDAANLSGWHTNSVRDISGLFAGATRFNEDITRWNLSQVDRAIDVFTDATAFNQPLCSWWTFFIKMKDYTPQEGNNDYSYSHRRSTAPVFGLKNTSCPEKGEPDLNATSVTETTFCHGCRPFWKGA